MSYYGHIQKNIAQGKKALNEQDNNRARDYFDTALVLLAQATLGGQSTVGIRNIVLLKTQVWNLLEKNDLLLPENSENI